MPIFAPITTLLVIQSSVFNSLGMTAQRVLGTGLGVAVATVYVTYVPIVWWSVFLALLVSVLVARQLPFGLPGQLQIPLATVFVLALGPGDLAIDLWRVGDVLLGAAVGLLAMVVAPPAPQLSGAAAALESFRSRLVALLTAMAEEIGAHAVPLPAETRHAFIGTSRGLLPATQSTLDAMDVAVESVQWNPRARRSGADLERLRERSSWLRRVSIQARGLAGALDRLYDRPGPAPLLLPAVLAPLLLDLAALVEVVDRDGADDVDAHLVAERLTARLRAAVAAVATGRQAVDALDSLSVLGRLDHLRELVALGPLPPDDVEAAPEDETAASSTATEHVRRLLGRDRR